MKIIVMGLALANVSYFLWAHGIADAPPPPPPPVPSLTLASEAPRLVPAAPLATASAGAAGPDAAAAAPLVTPGGDDDAPPVPTLGLAGAPAGLPAPAAADTATSSVVAAPKRCVSMGPFRDVTEAAHAATRLRTGGYDPRQRAMEGEIWAGVWVYLPMPSAPAAAEQLTNALKSGGVDDAMEMPGPGDGSVMSLGLFSDQKRAQGRIAQAQSLGFKPLVVDRKRAATLYWIDVDLKPTDNSLNPADIQAEAGRISRLELRSCPTGAAP